LTSIVVHFAMSRRPRPIEPAPPELTFVCLVPALNEGRVVGATVTHLLDFPFRHVIVIDDGSDDDTAQRVRAVDDRRVVLISRRLPHAREGKGRALNVGYRWVRHRLAELDPKSVVICVADADGRLHSGACHEVAPAFVDPAIGGAQVSVRIRNWRAGYWTKMQHFEFISFTALFQRARQHTGAVGLGGNGQFVRLEALMSLGDAPWSDCLTEDMDLGIRLLLNGWRNAYVPTSWVSQQAIPNISRLLRQRTRWFHGALQCLRHLPAVMSSPKLPFVTMIDLAATLLAPLFVLFVSPLLVAGWVVFAVTFFTGHSPLGVVASHALVLTGFYLLAFLPAFVMTLVFWLDEPEFTFLEAVTAGHQFIGYWYVWSVVAWMAVGRVIVRQRAWAKTARVQEDVILPSDEIVLPADKIIVADEVVLDLVVPDEEPQPR
jgi:cellulose synthase/poly-beta-1,6-N-acetylglucosamine synthase-like glycosyltransferase